jgi:hypothetical protein
VASITVSTFRGSSIFTSSTTASSSAQSPHRTGGESSLLAPLDSHGSHSTVRRYGSCSPSLSMTRLRVIVAHLRNRFSNTTINQIAKAHTRWPVTGELDFYEYPCSPTPPWGFPHHDRNPSWVATWDGPVDGPRDAVTPRRDGLGGILKLWLLLVL